MAELEVMPSLSGRSVGKVLCRSAEGILLGHVSRACRMHLVTTRRLPLLEIVC